MGCATGLLKSWWDRRHRTMARARWLLEQLYLCSVTVEPPASASTLRQPTFQGNGNVHQASSELITWLAWLQKTAGPPKCGWWVADWSMAPRFACALADR
jgi:hypothetical protein